MRLSMTILAATACLALAGPAAAEGFDFSKMSDQDRATFREEVRKYLLENPEVIYDAIQVLQQRRDDAAGLADRDLVKANADEIFADGHSWSNDNAAADITIVEFLDYRCSYCKRAHPDVEELLERDTRIKLIVKEFPILGPDSVAAGRMALAALQIDPGKYRALNNALMAYKGNLTEAAAYQIAGELGFDIARLKALAGEQSISDMLNKNYQLAQALGIQGTPTFVVGGQIIRGYLPVDDMQKVVEQEREASN